MGIYLPRWVWIGAGALSAVAGMVNVVGYLGFAHQAVTHLTGSTTLLGSALATHDVAQAARLAGAMLAFVVGAALSGLIVQDAGLRLGARYGVALTLESLLLSLAVPLFRREHFAGMLLAAMACGVQNAMATTYSGAAVRTTHVSGMLTDLGIGLGHAMRGMAQPRRRLLLSALIVSSFFIGSFVGSVLFGWARYDALLVPATLTGLVGLGYTAYARFNSVSTSNR